ncbi:hypothetical protein PG991_013073 [Apiospora marii]|uniref:Uncharacterized protein n=1 Tax=Apiospora marii TaxID=335849 RepID=A0ABR1R504_9PEZI
MLSVKSRVHQKRMLLLCGLYMRLTRPVGPVHAAQGSTTSFLTATTLIYATGAGNTPDRVVARVRDTRIYVDFETEEVDVDAGVREYTMKEGLRGKRFQQ